MRSAGLLAHLDHRAARLLVVVTLVGAALVAPVAAMAAHPVPDSDSLVRGSVVLGADSFSRLSSRGWGTAETGGAYDHPQTDGGFSVAGSTGQLVLSKAAMARSATLSGLAVRDVEVQFRVALDRIANGTGAVAEATLRQRGGDEYRTRVKVRADGSLRLAIVRVRDGRIERFGLPVPVAGLRLKPGASLWVHAQVVGARPTVIRASVWAVGSSRPAGWQIQRSDAAGDLTEAGAVGLRARLSPTTTTLPVRFTFDDLRVDAPASSPPPHARPFPAPVTSRTVCVPSSIDASGSSDVSDALASFIRGVPDGSVICFPAGARYRIDGALRLGDRHHLVLDGNGATLRMGVTGWTQASSLVDLFAGSSDIVIRDLTLTGASPTPGELIDGHEFAMGVNVDIATRIELSGLTIGAVYGDALTIDSWASDVWFHDSHVVSAGRNGVAILAARDVLVERTTFDKTGLHPFDIEPYQASGGAIGVSFLDNVVRDYGSPAPSAGQWAMLFAISGTQGATVERVTLRGTTVIDRSIESKAATLLRPRDIAVVDNRSLSEHAPRAGNPAILVFEHIDGLTVRGNSQPRREGLLVSIADSTGVSRE